MPVFDDFFDDIAKTSQKTDSQKKMKIQLISYKKLEESKMQYRDISDEDVVELAELIQLDGEIYQPLLVRKNGGDTFEILAGHKRKKAATYLVEKLHEEKYQMLPCYVVDLSDVRAEFAVYSTNGYKNKSPYQIMAEIDGMKRLMESYPEEFASPAKGRLVERLAAELGMSSSTVSEYQHISNNLSDVGMEKFKTGELSKSAANTLASLPEEKQDELIRSGVTKDVNIKRAIKKDAIQNIIPEEVPDKIKNFVLYPYLGSWHREKIGALYQTNEELRLSEVGQEIRKIVGTGLYLGTSECSAGASRVGIKISWGNNECMLSWRNLAVWIKEEIDAGKFLPQDVLPGQTSVDTILPEESEDDDLHNEVNPIECHKIALDITSEIAENMLPEKLGLCPSCKSRVSLPYNKYFCGQCGCAVDWK